MTYLTVSIKDNSKVSTIKKLLQMIEGVSVSLIPNSNKEKSELKSQQDLNEVEITPLIQSLTGIIPSSSDNEEKEIIINYLNQKYK